MRPRVELVGDPAHAEAVEALGVQHLDRGRDDRLAGQRVAAPPFGRSGTRCQGGGGTVEFASAISNTVPLPNDVA